LAVANYHDQYGCLPPAYIADADGRPLHSWRVLLLPYLDQRDLYAAYDFSEPWDGPNNRKLLARRPRVYALSDSTSQRGTLTNYLAVVGPETPWPGRTTLRYEDIRDGAAQTILIVENVGAGVHWSEPRDLDYSTMNMTLADQPADGVSSRFAPPAVVTVSDEVRTLRIDLPPETLRALLTAAGAEEIGEHELATISDANLRPLRE
jgi:hypothetical protein